MRYGPEHKQRTREQILVEAGKAIRKQGPHEVSVADVMKSAGLTHGGFYAHFKSRDAMLVATIEHMFAGNRMRLLETFDRPPEQALTRYIDWYLSPEHRDARDVGCTVAVLASDLPRLSRPCQKAYAEGMRGAIDRLARPIEALGHPASLASSVFAELVGALSLARAESDPKRSDAILAASRSAVKTRLGL